MAKFDVVIAAKTVGEQGIKRLGNSMQGVQGKVKILRIEIYVILICINNPAITTPI